MTHKVGPKGQVVIPKDMRDELGLEPGDEVDFELVGDTVVVRPARRFESLRGILAGTDALEMLEAERRRDREKEDRLL